LCPAMNRRTRHEGRLAVTKFKPGDLAAVGCLIDSDRTYPRCKVGLENFCPNLTLTFNYSDSVDINERFRSASALQSGPRRAAPLLCAGITTYSPMRHWGITKDKKVGVAGLGRRGHMAVKFAHALGTHVVNFTTSPSKRRTRFVSAPAKSSFPGMRTR